MNYLAWKAFENNLRFAKNQFLRPIIGLKYAGLMWNNEDWQKEVAKLSERIHGIARNLYFRVLCSKENEEINICNLSVDICSSIRRGKEPALFEIIDGGRDFAIKKLAGRKVQSMKLRLLYGNVPDFDKLIEIIEQHVTKNELEKAFPWITGSD